MPKNYLDPDIPSDINFEKVYQPNSDTFILCDALEKELTFLQSQDPHFCVEIGYLFVDILPEFIYYIVTSQ